MNRIFADTLYWGALIYPRDQYHNRAAAFARLRSDAHLVTTEEILAEFLDGLAHRGQALRQLATLTVDAVLTNSEVTVHPQSHESFLAALELYRRRPDKGYSLVDCVSMNTMRRGGITQEGFRILLG